MFEVGIANVMEKKEIEVDGNMQVYWECIDSCCGIIVNFNRAGKCFVSISSNLGMEIPTKYNRDIKYNVSDFVNLHELAQKNNNSLNISKFISDYNKYVGRIYEHTGEYFNRVMNERIIKLIKNSNKDYDSSVLNNNTDISQMYNSIKETIISQDEQIMQILTTLFKNQRVINSSLDDDIIAKLKENLIVYGSTGTGKTEILKRISKIYKVPIVIEDATSFSETGYIGGNIEDMLKNLYLAAGKDIELAQKGILVIDEFDKLAEDKKDKDHVSRIGVQRSLLKLLDGTTYYIDNKKFDTSKLSIVALGAFTGISKNDDYSNISSMDFVEYGIMRELMGRFSKMVYMNPLDKDDLKKILKESNFSPLNTYHKFFESMNIKFSYDENFVDYIAEKTLALKTGARSIKTVFDKEIGSAMFRIFAEDYSSVHLRRPKEGEKCYVLSGKKDEKNKRK